MQRGSLILLLVLTACTQQKLALDNFVCDDGDCVEGYSCHPETNTCVPAVAIDCSTAGSVCPGTLATGDACPTPGSYLPCSNVATDCSQGCRTCGEDLTWSACTQPPVCEGVRVGDNCSACESRCLDLPNIQRTRCDVSTGVAKCQILKCKEGFTNANLSEADGCEALCGDADVCNGIDDDCNGLIDDVAPEALSTACAAAQPSAVNIASWACQAGQCAITACTPGSANDNGMLADGCEGTCIPTEGGEVCDGVDNDCDGLSDPPGTTGCVVRYRDRDGDQVGNATDSKCLCAGDSNPDYQVTEAGDLCDDDKPFCTVNCTDMDSDGLCEDTDCSDSLPDCRTCGDPGCPVPVSYPDRLTITPSAPVTDAGSRLVTLTIGLTNAAGDVFPNVATSITCTSPAQQIVLYDFAGATASGPGAPFTEVSGTVSNGTAVCSGMTAPTAMLAERTGGLCLGGAQSVMGTTTNAINLTGWLGITYSALYNRQAQTTLTAAITCAGGAEQSVSPASTGCTALTGVALTAAQFTSGSGCSDVRLIVRGDDNNCANDANDGPSHVDDVAFSGTPILPAHPSQSAPGVYTMQVRSGITGSRITTLSCTYSYTDGGGATVNVVGSVAPTGITF